MTSLRLLCLCALSMVRVGQPWTTAGSMVAHEHEREHEREHEHEQYVTNSNTPGYRLGDAVQSPRRGDAVVKSAPHSIATEYIGKTREPRNYDVLAAIVRRRAHSVAPPPSSVVVIHLRLGDVANRLGKAATTTTTTSTATAAAAATTTTTTATATATPPPPPPPPHHRQEMTPSRSGSTAPSGRPVAATKCTCIAGITTKPYSTSSPPQSPTWS